MPPTLPMLPAVAAGPAPQPQPQPLGGVVEMRGGVGAAEGA